MDPIVSWIVTTGAALGGLGLIIAWIRRSESTMRGLDRVVREWQGEPPVLDASGAEVQPARPGIPARVVRIEQSSAQTAALAAETATLVADMDQQLRKPGGIRKTLDHHERRITGHDVELGELRAALRRNHPDDPATVKPDPIPIPPGDTREGNT